MKKIRILHLTDFHFSNDKRAIANQNRLIDSLKKSLDKEIDKINYLFFTGDLVNSGKEFIDFENAKSKLLEDVSSHLNLDKKDVFICAGNHDVNRGQELDDINESISKLRTNDELDEYVLKQEGKSFEASLANFNNYLKFQNNYYKDSKDVIESLFTIHKRNFNGVKVNITTINSAWRAINSKTDSGNLLYPLHFLKSAYEIIKKDNGINILLLHHPLSDFKYWNSQALEDIIFKDYHLMFSGHTHKKRDTVHVVPEIGMYSCTSPATLSLDGESKIGYSIIEVDLESFELRIENKIFQKDEEVFYSSEPLIGQIPVNEKKQKENRFRETVRKRFNTELEKANDLFLSYSDKKDKSNFLELFTEPIIDVNSKTHVDKSVSKSKKINLEQIKNSRKNEILFGKDKSGKTAILFKILLDSLNEFSSSNVLPIYINCKDLTKSTSSIDIIKTIRDFYELSTSDSENLSKKYHIKILLDNLNENEKFILTPLNDYISKYKNASIIATAEETLLNGFSNRTINGTSFNNLFVWDIGRTEIRSLTNKWPTLTEDSREILLEKIHKVFSQLNIPSNYWTVSLFIWIFEKNSDATFRNNFQLIELYIDNLLDKESFVSQESIYKIDFEDLKSYLSELAHHLVTKHNETNYVISYVDLINFTSDYKKGNRKFVIDTQTIVDVIIDKGVLKKMNADSYTFRLNGVFEYFLAFYMKDNSDFRNEVIDDGHFYLSFGNEFEICAGFNSRDIGFVEKIYKKTIEIFRPINLQYNFEKIDDHLKLIIQDKLKIDLRKSGCAV
jgi:predicted MPP superfamily phosphohydrolase